MQATLKADTLTMFQDRLNALAALRDDPEIPEGDRTCVLTEMRLVLDAATTMGFAFSDLPPV